MGIVSRLASRDATPPRVRMYHAARPSRLAGGAGSNTSADMELSSSLTTLRSRSRQLCRDASYAKRARLLIMNNVIGAGVGLQAKVLSTRGRSHAPVNEAIEELFEEWCEPQNCHMGGRLHLHDLERLAIGDIFEAGEALIRFHYRPVGDSPVPLALEFVEAERVADTMQAGPYGSSSTVRLGVETDDYHRPLFYWLRSQRELGTGLGLYSYSGQPERVPAQDLVHLAVIERWPQTRGVPWLHTAIRRLQDMDGYSEAEIVAARAAANYLAFLETPEADSTLAGKEEESGERVSDLEPGIVMHGQPGEKINFFSPNRPNSAMDPFMRLMLREVASGTGPSYESLSRDYSQSNYSSSRLALLDDRDLWRVLQQWYIRSFRRRLHRVWLQQAVLAGALPGIALEAYGMDPRRYEKVRFKPRGWSWVDPTKEVQAAKESVRNGFTTVSQVIAQTGNGMDLEDVLEERAAELEAMAEAGLSFDTDPGAAPASSSASLTTPASGAPPADPPLPAEDPEADGENAMTTRPARVVSLGR